MRYRGAAGGAEKAHSRQRHWCLWSKPVNLGTWGLVPGPISMAHASAELRYGTVVYTLAKTVSDVGTFGPYPYKLQCSCVLSVCLWRGVQSAVWRTACQLFFFHC